VVCEGVQPCKGAIEWRLLWWFARVFGLAKERLNRGYSGGLQRVFDLVKSDFDGCSGGSQGVRRRSGLEGIALGVEKRLRWR